MLRDEQILLHARQLLLVEIGAAGQERLCEATAHASANADPEAYNVALEYLTRSGMRSTSADAADGGFPVQVPESAAVRALAGSPELTHAAAWLVGAFAAVETIKEVCRAGQPAKLDPAFTLATETT